MKIAGVIIAGGSGSRLGVPAKPLTEFGNGTLLDAVLARMRPQASPLALNIPANQASLYTQYAAQGLTLIHEPLETPVGPLGGIIAGLTWLQAQNAGDWLATFPADTPFLPLDLVAQLTAQRETDSRRVVVAHDGERLQPLCALWPVTCLDDLRHGVDTDNWRAIQRAFDKIGSTVHNFPQSSQAFFNINTPDDLRRADAHRQRLEH